jgi:hypothetical protein
MRVDFLPGCGRGGRRQAGAAEWISQALAHGSRAVTGSPDGLNRPASARGGETRALNWRARQEPPYKANRR